LKAAEALVTHAGAEIVGGGIYVIGWWYLVSAAEATQLFAGFQTSEQLDENGNRFKTDLVKIWT